MSQERAPVSVLFRISLHALEQRREAAAISLTAAVLAVMALSANPSPANAESQTGYTTSADNNPITIEWGSDLKTVDPSKLAITVGFWTVLIAIGARELTKEDSK